MVLNWIQSKLTCCILNKICPLLHFLFWTIYPDIHNHQQASKSTLLAHVNGIGGCPHITSANFRGFQTPPPPLVSNCQHLLDPPPPRQLSSAFGRPPLYQCIQAKHTFWYEMIMAFWLYRTEKLIWNKVGIICLFCLFYTHRWNF